MQFKIEVPSYMSKANDLNENAAMQYQNIEKEAYVIVIEDSKEQLNQLGIKFSGSEGFLKSFVHDYQSDAENRTLSEIKNFESNGYKLAQTEMRWSREGVGFYMIITAVETPGYFYKILAWTLADKEKELKEDFIKISSSLKEMN